MQSLHITGGLDPRNGGPAYTVPRLCESLRIAGIGAEILSLEEGGTGQIGHARLFPLTGAKVPVLSRLKLSFSLQRALEQDSAKVDLIHSHGLWIAPNIYAGQAAVKSGKPLVVSPRGMLSPGALAFSSRKKRLLWKAWQGPAYRGVAAWHATSFQEAVDIRKFGIAGPIAVIPNGVDLPLDIAAHHPGKTERTILFLSRIHPKKGLPKLLETWRQLAPERPDWRLLIVGPDEGGHLAELEAKVLQHSIPRVAFSGPLYGQERDTILTDADLFVLPTLSENFGIAVAEALAAGLPAIVTKGAPWEGLQSERCGWWVEGEVEYLLGAMRAATALPASERKAMGYRGRAWMQRQFGWDAIGREMRDLYGWLAAGGPRPACVQVS